MKFMEKLFSNIIASAHAEESDNNEDEFSDNDPMILLKNKCQESGNCKPINHHFLECSERVLKQQSDPNYENLEDKEDCVEEFLHLQACIDKCVAPKLFERLK